MSDRPPVEVGGPNWGRRAGGRRGDHSAPCDAMTSSPDFDAARHLLATPPLGRRTAPHVGEDGFDWNALFGLVAAGPEQ